MSVGGVAAVAAILLCVIGSAARRTPVAVNLASSGGGVSWRLAEHASE
jgi:hypothetical protein